MTAPLDQWHRPLRDLRISVIDTCNYRCNYCMPADKFTENHQFLRPHQRLYFEEITWLARAFAQLGVNKLRLTGGEPLLRKDLHHLVAMLADIAGITDLALTTNGLLLQRHLKALVDAGLNRVTVSLDSMDAAQYRALNGQRGDLATVLKAIDAALESPLKSIKLNCVIQKGVNEDQIVPLVQRFANTRAVLRFIEFMDVGNVNDWRADAVVTSAQVRDVIQQHVTLEPLQANYRGEVASRYRLGEGGGEIGFISSISQPFCGDCSRARLSADGQLYTCLFAQHGHDLKPLLRYREDEEAVLQAIRSIWSARSDRYSQLRKARVSPQGKIEMYVIGG